MQCTSPLLAAWYKPGFSPESALFDLDKPRIFGKFCDLPRSLTPARFLGAPEWAAQYLDWILLPCGRCIACRLRKSSEWSMRCNMEAAYHPASSFITLTVDPVHMDTVFPGDSLCYQPFQAFMKRLRDRIGSPIRFLMCGEYGDLLQRPHYHCLVFGYDFPDRYPWKIVGSDYAIYRSPLLEDCWKFGFSTVEDLCEFNVNYVCRYVLKKVSGACASGHYQGRMPEFIRTSNRPGIGAKYFFDYVGRDFFKKGLDQVWYNDYIRWREKKMSVPRYYGKLFERLDNADFVSLKTNRRLLATEVYDLHECDLLRQADYLQESVKGRIKKGVTNV